MLERRESNTNTNTSSAPTPAGPTKGGIKSELRGMSFAEQEARLSPGGPDTRKGAAAGAPAQNAPSAGTSNTKAPAGPQDKIGVGFTGTRGPLNMGLKFANDGSMTAGLEGKYAAPLTPIPVGPLYLDPALALKSTGTATMNLDGSFKGKVGADIEAGVTLRGGIPKVMSVGAGAKTTLSMKGVEVARSKEGAWSLSVPDAVLKFALVVSAELGSPVNGEPQGWKSLGTKLEWNPGGELELLKTTYQDGSFQLSEGKDGKRLVDGIESLAKFVGSMNPFEDNKVRSDVEAGAHKRASTKERVTMIEQLMSGVCGTEDEAAILKILDYSSEKGDLAAVLAGLDRKALIAKVNDDANSKAALERYLLPPKDALGPRPGRFSVLCSPFFPLDGKSDAVKLDGGSVWTRSKAYNAVLRDRVKTMGLPEMRAELAQVDKHDGWLEAHKKTSAIAAEPNNNKAYTLYFNSQEAAQSEVKMTAFMKSSLNPF